MAIFFLRHGESEANVTGLFAGQKDDTPLTETGIMQAKAAADSLVNISVDKIIASRLRRTQQTAAGIAQAIGFDLSATELDDRILEYDMGALTGTPIRKVSSRELTSAEGAEDPVAFQNRVISFLQQYKASSENILIVSHAGVGRMIEATREGLDPAEFYNLPAYPNAQVVELHLDWLDQVVQ